jgi:hypothetical protein
MVVDLPLRFTWILTVSNFEIWSPLFIFMISSLEIFRVFLWNFIRVEREHVVNVGDFRVVLNMELPYKGDILKELNK